MTKTHAFAIVSVAAAVICVAACSSGDSSSGKDSLLTDSAVDTTMTMADTSMSSDSAVGVMVGGAIMLPAKTIAENAAESKDHTTLVLALKSAGYAQTLREKGPFTVFAPTDEAFNKLPKAKLDRLLSPAGAKELRSLLDDHVVPGLYKSGDLKEGMELTTAGGSKLRISLKDGNWWVNDARITIPDVVSSNGVAFVTDAVLNTK
ncbi:fasciclin domain-containing protein [Pedobacter sp. SYP-B3415]|uniref:fasciclin domain-containing protein n=1 Tax=Pedobacter sp. SYP-B3415 TaxID=2496641 RepID=UPI00101CF237|nr:fasciclin domain-containing protein [Pedobacter sp. SYP-B3415]